MPGKNDTHTRSGRPNQKFMVDGVLERRTLSDFAFIFLLTL